eukprot:1178823-Prorocentrum_minimum.AAC.2
MRTFRSRPRHPRRRCSSGTTLAAPSGQRDCTLRWRTSVAAARYYSRGRQPAARGSRSLNTSLHKSPCDPSQGGAKKAGEVTCSTFGHPKNACCYYFLLSPRADEH